MKKDFSNSWKSSKQPRKQRKYRYNAPLHIVSKFLSSHLSPELRAKHEIRSKQIRSGDKVKVLRGQFKGHVGKVERADIKARKIYISKIEVIKKDGTKAFFPVEPSNVMILELNLEDKRRMKRKKSNIKKSPENTESEDIVKNG